MKILSLKGFLKNAENEAKYNVVKSTETILLYTK